ncbi:hypothetical protein P7G87_00525 [Enterococcus asini]|uniref:hypothetical protein n=1 Tax=Enterococcus asini TaxID=57732 RepID=UPI00288CB5D6|nr:hypothetical protein [Enterococcus asini]MDT2783172.1 hypothetical protein [Enterococcus asini]
MERFLHILINILTLVLGTVGFTLGLLTGNIWSIAFGGVAVLLSILNIISAVNSNA